MLIGSLHRTGLFLVVEDEERADAFVRGAAEDLIYSDSYRRRDGLNVRGSASSSELLQGTTTGQGLFDLLSYVIRLEHDFEGNTCEVGGLPPLKGDLTIRLLSGDMVGDEVTLPAGSTTLTYRL